MHTLRSFLAALVFFVSPFLGHAADAPAEAVKAATHEAAAGGREMKEHAEAKEHGLPSAAPRFQIGPFMVTNSMVLTWIVAVFLIVFARVATKNIQAIPQGAQNFWEWLVESLYGFLEGIIGAELVKKTFWFFATIFIFILFTNWFGLIPGVGTIGYGIAKEPGSLSLEHVSSPFFRGANADLNMTLAMAMVFFACWTVWALQANGPGGFILHLFGPKGDTKGALKVLMILVFIAVGVLEVVSILFRPVSLSFRLYGNIFAGENMLETMSTMGGSYFGWLLPLPFYGMELLVGIVQALVFMLLTSVFTLLICTHEEGHGEGHHH